MYRLQHKIPYFNRSERVIKIVLQISSWRFPLIRNRYIDYLSLTYINTHLLHDKRKIIRLGLGTAKIKNLTLSHKLTWMGKVCDKVMLSLSLSRGLLHV